METRGDESSATADVGIVRCLVVDDDAALRQYLETLLKSLGSEVLAARDGQEAEYYLRTTQFDVVFLDLRLPAISGELVLELMSQGRLKTPGGVILMSTAEYLRGIPEAEWPRLRVRGVLEKPFGAAEVRTIVEKALGRPLDERRPPTPRFVVLGGSDLWLEALARVLERSGGVVERARTAVETIDAVRKVRPMVVVCGPPMPDYDVLEVASALRSDTSISGTTLLVATNRADGVQCRCLVERGVAGVILIPPGMPELCTEVSRRAGLPRRSHVRVEVAGSVVIETSRGTYSGNALDVSEGGIGVNGLPDALPAERFDISFQLPGDSSPVHAGVEVAWVAPSASRTWRAGLRFRNLGPRDEKRIRSFVEKALSTGTG